MASISKRSTKNGVKWRVQIRRPGHAPIHRTANTRAEAQEIARDLEREIDIGNRVLSRDMTVGELIRRYTDDMGGQANLTKSKATSFGHFERLIGRMRIADLDNREIVKFARKRQALGSQQIRKTDKKEAMPKLSRATITMDINYLRDLLDYGSRNYGTPMRIAEMQLARLDLRKEKLTGKARTVYNEISDADFAELVEEADKDNRLTIPLATILKIARSTGMREAEFTRITWPDLNADTRVLLIPRRKHPQNPYDKEMPLIPNHGIDPLAEILDMEGFRLPDQAPDDDRIFPFCKGSIGTAYRRIRYRINKRRRENGEAPIRARFHDLRHDAATALARNKDIHFREAMVILGHDDVGSISRYTHFTAAEIAERHGGPPPTRSGNARFHGRGR